MTTKKLEKQLGFEGTKSTAMAKDREDSDKNARTGSQPVLSTKGLLVGKNRRLTADSQNIIVSRKVVSKTSDRERWECEGFFGTLAGALHFLVEKGVKETELRDLQMVVDRVEELKRDISLALKGIEIEC